MRFTGILSSMNVDYFKKNYALILLKCFLGMFFLFCFSMIFKVQTIHGCTIGVANGNATPDGRAIIWKNRDRRTRPDNMVVYHDEAKIDFIAVEDTSSTNSWMGINEKGFGIMNSASSDLEKNRTFANGSLMQYALGNCFTIEDFQNLLDSTNFVGRETAGNFGVIDSTGAAVLFEVSDSVYWKYDTEDSENGYIVRTNFSLSGGSSEGLNRYKRAVDIVDGLFEKDSLSYKNIVQELLRDFSDPVSNPYSVPYDNYSTSTELYGYFDASSSISASRSVSAVVIQSILPDEPAYLSTMWTLLGNPATTIALPFWATGELPEEATGKYSADLCSKSLIIKKAIYDVGNSRDKIDSFKLLNSRGTGIWSEIFTKENDIFTQTEIILEDWRDNPPNHQEIGEYQEQKTEFVCNFLDTLSVENSIVAGFHVDKIEGVRPLQVQFYNQVLHQPDSLFWDFNSDGIYDSNDFNPSFTFENEGHYSITLKAIKANQSDSITINNYITVFKDSSAFSPEVQSGITKIYPNPFIPISSYTNNSGNFTFLEIHYAIKNDGLLKFKLYNLKGELINTYKYQETAGEDRFLWDGKNVDGKTVSSGIYFLRMILNNEVIDFKRLTIIR